MFFVRKFYVKNSLFFTPFSMVCFNRPAPWFPGSACLLLVFLGYQFIDYQFSDNWVLLFFSWFGSILGFMEYAPWGNNHKSLPRVALDFCFGLWYYLGMIENKKWSAKMTIKNLIMLLVVVSLGVFLCGAFEVRISCGFAGNVVTETRSVLVAEFGGVAETGSVSAADTSKSGSHGGLQNENYRVVKQASLVDF